MAYAALPSKSSSDTITLADYNKIKGNFEAGCPDIIAAKGDLCVGTGADAADRLAVGVDNSILTADSFETTGLEWQSVPGARVYNDANIDPATSTWVALTFNSERTDVNGMHSTSSNTSRLTIPALGGGLYFVGGGVEFDTSGLGAGSSIKGVQIRLTRPGVSNWVIARYMTGATHASFDMVLTICTMYQLAAVDYVELEVYTSNDVDVVASSNYSPEFWAMWQRKL